MKVFNCLYLSLLLACTIHLHTMDAVRAFDVADASSSLKKTQCNWVKGFGISFTLGSGYYLLENIMRDYCSNGACNTYGCAVFCGVFLTACAYWQEYKNLKRDIKFPIKNILPLLDAIKKRQNEFVHVIQEALYVFIPNALRDFPDAISLIQQKRNKLERFMILAEKGGKLCEALQYPLPSSKLFPFGLPPEIAEKICKWVRLSAKRELEYTNTIEVSRYEIEEYRLRNGGGRELRE
jgi:hypothetical protein